MIFYLLISIILWMILGAFGVRRYLSGPLSLSPSFERLLFWSSGPYGWIILFRFWRHRMKLKQFSKAPPSA